MSIQKAIPNLIPNNQYVFRVRAINQLGVASNWSEAIVFTPDANTTLNGPPTNLVLVPQPNAILAQWSPVYGSDFEQYVLYVGTDPNFMTNQPTAINTTATAYLYVPADPTLVYYFAVAAQATDGTITAYAPSVPIGAEVGSLAAANLTAGSIAGNTIEPTTIIMGPSSTIQSSNYSQPSYLGWELTNTSINIYQGFISISATNNGAGFNVDSQGNMWIGSNALFSAPFGVSNSGLVYINNGGQLISNNVNISGGTIVINGINYNTGLVRNGTTVNSIYLKSETINVSPGSSGTFSYTFPTAFPTACIGVTASISEITTLGLGIQLNSTSFATTGFSGSIIETINATALTTGTYTITYIAIGN